MIKVIGWDSQSPANQFCKIFLGFALTSIAMSLAQFVVYLAPVIAILLLAGLYFKIPGVYLRLLIGILLQAFLYVAHAADGDRGLLASIVYLVLGLSGTGLVALSVWQWIYQVRKLPNGIETLTLWGSAFVLILLMLGFTLFFLFGPIIEITAPLVATILL